MRAFIGLAPGFVHRAAHLEAPGWDLDHDRKEGATPFELCAQVGEPGVIGGEGAQLFQVCGSGVEAVAAKQRLDRVYALIGNAGHILARLAHQGGDDLLAQCRQARLARGQRQPLIDQGEGARIVALVVADDGLFLDPFEARPTLAGLRDRLQQCQQVGMVRDQRQPLAHQTLGAVEIAALLSLTRRFQPTLGLEPAARGETFLDPGAQRQELGMTRIQVQTLLDRL
jgi:hypothetical protein